MTTTEAVSDRASADGTRFDGAKAEAFGGRIMSILTGSLLSSMVDIGHRTGLFAVAAEGPATTGRCCRSCRPVLIARFTTMRNSHVRNDDRALESIQATEQAQPGVLRDLFGHGRAAHVAAGEPDHRRVMAVDQAREGLLVAGPQAPQQLAFIGVERRTVPQIFRTHRDREPHTRWSPGERWRYTVTQPLRA